MALLKAAGFSVAVLPPDGNGARGGGSGGARGGNSALAAAARGKLIVNLWNAPNSLSGAPTTHALLNRVTHRLYTKLKTRFKCCAGVLFLK